MDKEELVDCYELWVECDSMEAHAATSDGKSMKMVAQVVNGIPIYLEDKAILETRKLTKKESDLIINKKSKTKSNL